MIKKLWKKLMNIFQNQTLLEGAKVKKVKVSDVAKIKLLKGLYMLDLMLKFLMLFKLLILIIQLKKLAITKIGEIENKITDHDHNNKCITAQEFNKLTAVIFCCNIATYKFSN